MGALALCLKGSLVNSISLRKNFIYFLIVFVMLALTGSVSSLAGTLFPTTSLSFALILDFMPESHLLLKLRILHPLFAILFIVGLFYLKKEILGGIIYLALATGIIGLMTLLTLSPMILKMSHLLIAHVFWMFLCVNCFNFKKGLFLNTKQV